SERLVIDGVEVAYDDGPDVRPQEAVAPNETARELAIAFFTDCKAGEVSGSCGGPPARWVGQRVPVDFCTYQANRPSSMTAQQFRDAVEAAARMWTDTEVRVGVRYTGDCDHGVRWENGNERNEIGFDDARSAVNGSAAAVARGSWVNIPVGGPVQDRHFTEFDIIVDERL